MKTMLWLMAVVLLMFSQFTSTYCAHVTAEQIDKKLGLGAKHVACHVRITGYYMKRHCKREFNSPLRCDLNGEERRKVKKVAKLCCEDAPSCEPSILFDEFCCLDGNCGESDCQPWDNALEEIELANLVFNSDQIFHDVETRIIENLQNGITPPYLPDALLIYLHNPSLILENEQLIKRYLKSHRVQSAHIAKSLGIINQHNQIVPLE